MQIKDIINYPDKLIDASLALLYNEKILNAMIAILYNKTNVYNTITV